MQLDVKGGNDRLPGVLIFTHTKYIFPLHSPTHTVHISQSSPPMVVSWNSSNCPLTNRSTRLDFPTAMSPSSTSLNWQILVCGSVPLERPPLPLELIPALVGDGRGAGAPPSGGDRCFWDISHLRCLPNSTSSLADGVLASLHSLFCLDEEVKGFVLVQNDIMPSHMHAFLSFSRQQTLKIRVLHLYQD